MLKSQMEKLLLILAITAPCWAAGMQTLEDYCWFFCTKIIFIRKCDVFFPHGLIDLVFSSSSLDLSGKVFIFSRESNSDHVKLKTSNTVLNSASTCLR